MTTTHAFCPADAVTDFQVNGTLTPEGVAILETLLRDDERAAVSYKGGPIWGRADLRQKHGVGPRAGFELVREKAGYGFETRLAWYAAEALDATTGSSHCKRLLSEYGPNLLGINSPVEEPEYDDA